MMTSNNSEIQEAKNLINATLGKAIFVLKTIGKVMTNNQDAEYVQDVQKVQQHLQTIKDDDSVINSTAQQEYDSLIKKLKHKQIKATPQQIEELKQSGLLPNRNTN